jgi:4'-phosphopantetheinyl transferase
MAEALAAYQAHIWCADPDELAGNGATARAFALISDDERVRLARVRQALDQRLFLATRALVRQVLSRYEPIAPDAWRFTTNAHGRPEVSGASALRFNLSHTHGLVVCAVARVEVGVDVERHRQPAPLDVAQRFFAPVELADLRALPPGEQPRRFFDYWTLKESYLKARGIGMTVPLDRFWFLLDGQAPPRVVIDAALDDDGARWQFRQCQPTDEHLVSLCLLRAGVDEVELTLRWQSLA